MVGVVRTHGKEQKVVVVFVLLVLESQCTSKYTVPCTLDFTSYVPLNTISSQDNETCSPYMSLAKVKTPDDFFFQDKEDLLLDLLSLHFEKAGS